MPEAGTGWGVTGISVILGDRMVLNDVSLETIPGSVVAVVGGDGAGKTTLLRAMCGRVIPATGTVTVPHRRRIGYQPATAGSWANLTVEQNLAVVARAYGLDRGRLHQRQEDLLTAAGLLEARHRLASQLSGGMRQKLGFCMAILHEPEMLVLDEPSTGVDPVSRVELWALISDAVARGAAVVMATTYLDEAERTQQVLALDRGVALLQGTPAEVLADAPGTVTRVAVATRPSLAWRRGRQVRQWHPGPPQPGDAVVTPDMEDAFVAAALDHRGDGGSPVPVPPPVTVADCDVLIAATDVSQHFGGTLAVDHVSMRVAPGEIVGLIGANGAGKTTLIRMLLGLLEPSQGEVDLFGAPPSRQTRRKVGYVPQGLGLYRDLTVAENLAFVAAAYGESARPEGELAELSGDLVDAIGLGQRRQLAFACALAHAPALLVLDEPTSGVDPIARARLWDTIHTQAEAGAGLLVSTHYMQEAEQCDRLILMDLGRVVAEGTTAQIIESTTATQVRTATWTGAFEALRAADLPVALAGREVRVVDTSPDTVREVLGAAGVSCQVDVVPATLEEKMTAITRARAGVATL